MGNCKSTASISGYPDKTKLHHRSSVETNKTERTFASFVTTVQDEDIYDPVEVTRNSIIGGSQQVVTPFGSRRIVYADYTASGRYLKTVEDFLSSNVYPFYANTHTEASATGAITTHLREEARRIVAESLNAPQDEYAVLFVGTGCSGAIEKMMKVLGIHFPDFVAKKWNLTELIPVEDRPVVFIGPFEHHSNELPWRDSIATVVVIPEDKDGCPDMDVLEEKLNQYKDRRMKIGSFCAGSNVTGICLDTKPYARLLHKHNALAFFDFAGSGAYVDINISGGDESESMDAIFMSPHKFIGGPGCSGLLVARRSLFHSCPTFPGGGTVSFVSPTDQKFEDSIEAREDAGTPGIVQAIRTGLVFKVKDIVGCQRIEALERDFSKMVFSKLGASEKVELMGSDRGAYFDPHRRTTIFSFNIRSRFHAGLEASGLKGVSSNPNLMLHPSFVVGLLNDVYGIQARAGCSCTGPYGHRLFNVDKETSDRICVLTLDGYSSFKFGWARVSFNYFISREEAEFICDAILQIAEHGWKLLPLYKIDPKSGLYVYRNNERMTRPSLDDFRLAPELGFGSSEFLTNSAFVSKHDDDDDDSFQNVLERAQEIYRQGEKWYMAAQEKKVEIFDSFTQPLPTDVVSLDDIWWLTPKDVVEQWKALSSRVVSNPRTLVLG